LHENELLRSEYGDRRLGIPRNKMVEWLKLSRFEVSRIQEFPVNMGLVVVLYEAEKK